jgi:hypothetical protein
MTKQYYAWISEKQRGKIGYCVWADADGKEIAATCINESPTVPPGEWDDIKCVGKVERFVCSFWAKDYEDQLVIVK